MHVVAILNFKALGKQYDPPQSIDRSCFYCLGAINSQRSFRGNSARKIQFSYSIGTQAGKQYCAKKAAQEAMEEGTAIAMGQASIPMSVISKMDFEDDRYALPMMEGMMSYAIDHCPQRAKRLFPDLYKMAD